MSQETQDNINRVKLADVLMTYAINSGLNNQLAIKKVHEMNTGNTPVKDYVLALADGLQYGNWPWTKPHTTRALMNNSHRYHTSSCPAYAGNEYPCECGMIYESIHYIGCPAYKNGLHGVCNCNKMAGE